MVSILSVTRRARHIQRQDSLEEAVQRKLEHGVASQVSKTTIGKLVDRVRRAPTGLVDQVLERLKTEGSPAARQMRRAIQRAYRFSDETIRKIESHSREIRNAYRQSAAQRALLAGAVVKRSAPLTQENLLRHTASHDVPDKNRMAAWLSSLPPALAKPARLAGTGAVSRDRPSVEGGVLRKGCLSQRSASIDDKALLPKAGSKRVRFQVPPSEESSSPPPPLPPAANGSDIALDAPSGLQAALTQALAKRRQAQEAAPATGGGPVTSGAVPSAPRPGGELMAELAATLAARAPKAAQ